MKGQGYDQFVPFSFLEDVMKRWAGVFIVVLISLFTVFSSFAQRFRLETAEVCYGRLSFRYPQEWVIGATNSQVGVIGVTLASSESALNVDTADFVTGDARAIVAVVDINFLRTFVNIEENSTPAEILRVITERTPPLEFELLGDIHESLLRGRPSASLTVTSDIYDNFVVSTSLNENNVGFVLLITRSGEASVWEDVILLMAETMIFNSQANAQTSQQTYISQDCRLRFRYSSELEVRTDTPIRLPDDDYAVYLNNNNSSLGMSATQVASGDVHISVVLQSTSIVGNDPEAALRGRDNRITRLSRETFGTRPAVHAVVQQEESERLYFAFLVDRNTMALIQVIAAPNEVGEWESMVQTIAESIQLNQP